MALKPKTALFQMRLDPELMMHLQVFADREQRTVSDFVRRLLSDYISHQIKSARQRGLEVRDGALLPIDGIAPGLPITNAYKPVPEVEESSPPMTRQARRQAERDQKKGR